MPAVDDGCRSEREATSYHPPPPPARSAARGRGLQSSEEEHKVGVKKRSGVGQEVRHVKRFQPSVCAVRKLEEEAEQRVKNYNKLIIKRKKGSCFFLTPLPPVTKKQKATRK